MRDSWSYPLSARASTRLRVSFSSTAQLLARLCPPPQFIRYLTIIMASRKRASDNQGPGGDTRGQTKKTKVNSGNEATSKSDSNGDQYWEISKMRRVTVSEFRGKTMVSVREYYEKDGQELPGKKVSFFFLTILFVFCLDLTCAAWSYLY